MDDETSIGVLRRGSAAVAATWRSVVLSFCPRLILPRSVVVLSSWGTWMVEYTHHQGQDDRTPTQEEESISTQNYRTPSNGEKAQADPLTPPRCRGITGKDWYTGVRGILGENVDMSATDRASLPPCASCGTHNLPTI